MDTHSHEPKQPALPATFLTARHDGWTGEKIATFCEALAETAIVAEACEAANMGISGAYAARRRNPVFAAAWDAALTIARERLADTLLARSMEGNVEFIYRDGECVGERHSLDNRLGLAILRRLDRLAETGATVSSRGERFVTVTRNLPTAPACNPQPFDWDMAMGALRSGEPDAVAAALAMFKGHEVEEVEEPPNSLSQGDSEPREIDLSDRCWRDKLDKIWLTDFPPPSGFTGYENHPWDEDDDEFYQRACTDEEVAILEAGAAAARYAERAEDEALRDSYFDMLKAELPDPAPAEPPGLARSIK